MANEILTIGHSIRPIERFLYARGPSFQRALPALIAQAAETRSTVMCAEAGL